MRARTGILMAGLGATLVAAGNALRARRRRAAYEAARPTLDDLAAHSEVPTIVILGAGFAGVSAARELARLLPRPSDGRIVLINETDFMVFTPMLTEIVGGKVDLRDVASPVRRLSPRVTFVRAQVKQVDLAHKQVEVLIGEDLPSLPPARRTIHADHLVLALGSVTNFHHVPGLEASAFTNKSIAEAGAIHDHALAILDRAAAEPDDERRRALLTFVVGGGGFSGVETMAALNGLVRSLAPHYPGIRADDLRTILVHPDDRLLPELGPRLAAYAQHELQARGVELILNTPIAGADAGSVRLRGRPPVPTHTLIWTAGVTPSPIVRNLPCRHGKHHGVATDGAFRVPDFPGVWAVGDCAEVPRPGSDATYTATAQNATREGIQVARNIVASLRGTAVSPFVYRPIGELALVGARAGVADVYGVHVAGFLAWLLWRAVYLAKEPSPGKRLRTAIDWLLDLAGPRALPTFPGRRLADPDSEHSTSSQRSSENSAAAVSDGERHRDGGTLARS